MPGPEASPPLAADRTLGGRYRLVAPLARGGMAEVWEGYDEVLDRPVAVKTLLSHLAGDQVVRERFRREAVTAANLAHNNVVALYDTGLDGGVAYIVMELVRGQTLRAMMSERGALSIPVAVAIADQIADALAAAHRAHLVHRDIKPANVLIADDDGPLPRIKVTDFGIAKAAESVGGDLTSTGMVLGTPKYLSPEQVEGREPDARADLYALGVVLFEMLTATPPFAGPTDMATALAHLRDPAPLVSSRRPGVPPPLDDLVAVLLAKDPAHRYVSAEDVRLALAAVGRAGQSRVGGGSARKTPVPPPLAGRPAGRAVDSQGPLGSPAAPVSPDPTVGAPAGRWGPVPAPPPARPRVAGAPGSTGDALRRRPRGVETGPTSAIAGSLGAPPPVGRSWVPSDLTQVNGGAPVAPRSPGAVGVAGPGLVPPHAPGWRGGGSAPAPVAGTEYVRQSQEPVISDGPDLRRRRPGELGDRPPPGPSPSPGRRRGPGVVVLVLLLSGGSVAGVLIARASRSGSAGGSDGGGAGGASASHRLVAARVFVLGTHTPDDPAGVDNVVDGNPATSWSTDRYANASFGNLYPGIGVAVELARPSVVHTMTVTAGSTGWAAQAYVATSYPADHASVAAWGSPVSSAVSSGTTTTFALGGRQASWVLLWLTSTGGPPFQAVIEDIRIA